MIRYGTKRESDCGVSPAKQSVAKGISTGTMVITCASCAKLYRYAL